MLIGSLLEGNAPERDRDDALIRQTLIDIPCTKNNAYSWKDWQESA